MKTSLRPALFAFAAVASLAASHTLRAGTVYAEDFEAGDPANFTDNSYWHTTANAPANGSYALGFVHNETTSATPDGSYAGTSGELELAFSPQIALPLGTPISLSFNARVDDELGDDPADYDRLIVGVSTDGTTQGTVVASSNPSAGGIGIPENVGYGNFTVDLSSFAGQSVYLSFGFETFDGGDDGHPGPRVDDLLITAPVPEPSTWMMMLGGLGALGVVQYRRRTRRV